MGKLKWNWLVPDSFMSLYDEHFSRWLMSIAMACIPGLFGLAATFGGGPLAIGIPLMVIAFVIIVGWGGFGWALPKLHYLNGLEGSQKGAVEWYNSLTADEKKQLPNGWESVVRESGNDQYEYKLTEDDYDYGRYYNHTVAYKMKRDAEDVIELYRKSNIKPKVADYRIDVYTQLMAERKAELEQQLTTQREIEDKIARMD